MTDDDDNVTSLADVRAARERKVVMKTFAGERVEDIVAVVEVAGARYVSIESPKDAEGWVLTPDQAEALALDLIATARGVKAMGSQ